MFRPFITVPIAFTVLSVASRVAASRYGLDFSKDLNVWSWKHTLAVSEPLGKRLLFTTKGAYERKISDTPGFARRSNEAGGDLRFAYAFTPKLSMGINMMASRSTLQTGATTSDVDDQRIASFLRYRPFAGLVLSQSLGRAYEKRRNVADAGLAYTLGLKARPLESALAAHGLTLAVDYGRDGVSSPQGDVTSTLSASATYALNDRISHEMQFVEVHDEQRYVSANPGNPIQRRLTENRAVISNLSALVPRLGAVLLESGYTSGLVDDDASDDPNDLKYRTNNRTRGWSSTATWTLPMSAPTLKSVVAIGKSERKADPVFISSGADSLITRPNDLDRNTSDLSVSFSGVTALSNSDSIRVSGTLALNRDHTPAITEVNDRDEYRRSVVGSYWHRFAPTTSIDLRVERSETHQVFLVGERSANNRWERVLNVWATTTIRTDHAAITQRGFFRTALEEYDFDYLTPDAPRSRNSRLGRLDFKGTFPLADATDLTVAYTIEARTHGNLLPAGPGRRPKVWQLTRNELAHVVLVSLTARLGRAWKLGPSISFNRQSEYTPTQPHWNPFALGMLTDRQEGMVVEAYVSYTPRTGIFDGNDAITARMNRTYRRRGRLHDRTTRVSFVYDHAF